MKGTHPKVSFRVTIKRMYIIIANSFVNYTAPRTVIITGILEDKKGRIWLAADDGLWIVDEQKLSIKKFILPNDTIFSKNVPELCIPNDRFTWR